MIRIDVELELHGPARIATGRAQRGLDAVLDHERLPASSLKGVMRAAARDFLLLEEPLIESLFGSPTQASRWAWSDAELPKPSRRVTTRVRVPLDPDTGTVKPGALFHAEEVWLSEPVGFQIEQQIVFPNAKHEAQLLAACAMAVKSLGASRNRGLGWVTMCTTIDGEPVDPATVAAAVAQARGVAR